MPDRRAAPLVWRLAAALLVAASPDAAAPVALTFVDQEGDRHVLEEEGGGLRWCSGPPPTPGAAAAPRRCRRVRDLRIERSGSGFKVVFAEPWARTAWTAVIAKPAEAAQQRELVERLVQVARNSRVRVTAECLHDSGGDAGGAEVLSLEPPLEVWAPLVRGKQDPGHAQPGIVHVSLPGQWRDENATGACIAIVPRRAACGPAAFRGPCKSRAMWANSDPDRFLRFAVPRPPFSMAAAAPSRHGAGVDESHVLCFRAAGPSTPTQDGRPGMSVLGPLRYFPQPAVQFMRSVTRVGVRTFLNPGWRQVVELECTNCSDQSRIVVQPILPDARCRDMAQQSLVAVAAAARDGQVPENVDLAHHRNSKVEEIIRNRGAQNALSGVTCMPLEHGPCTQAPSSSGIDDIDAEAKGEVLSMVGRPLVAGSEGPSVAAPTTTAAFLLQSGRRLLAKERQTFFHHRSALCFYPTPSSTDGWLVGFAAVQMDGPDMQAFIGFVCFFGVALPLICLVSALLHYNKYEQCKQHVHQLRLEFQRDQLDREMALRRTGAGASQSASVAWLPHWHRLLPGAYANGSVRGVGTL